MSALADTVTAVLAREFVATHRNGMRVLAVTSPVSLVAALAAQRLGASRLAIAAGFTKLDAVDPFPALTLGEAAYGVASASVGPASDTFVAVARGRVGVCTAPAQLDATGAANLSRIGGANDAPAVALPGSRGLPENNDMPGPVWYVLASHRSRQLVRRVDFVSGPPPQPGRRRRLLTPFGLFALEPGEGWYAVSLHAGVTAEDVARGTGFDIRIPVDVPSTSPPSRDELDALARVDPDGIRALEFLPPDEARELVKRVSRQEAARGT